MNKFILIAGGAMIIPMTPLHATSPQSGTKASVAVAAKIGVAAKPTSISNAGKLLNVRIGKTGSTATGMAPLIKVSALNSSSGKSGRVANVSVLNRQGSTGNERKRLAPFRKLEIHPSVTQRRRGPNVRFWVESGH